MKFSKRILGSVAAGAMVLTSMVMVGAPIASADGGTDTVVVKTATGIDNPDRTFTSTVPGTQVGLF